MNDGPAVGNWNLPNVLTGVRLLLVPVYGVTLLHAGGGSIAWRCAATVVFVVAMVTDKVDGDIARSRDLVTNVGKIADPIADKAMTGMALVGLSVIGDVWWWVTVVVLLREWSVTLLRLSILRRMVVPAAWSGKVKTVVQAVALTGLTLPLRLVHGWLHGPATALFYVAEVGLGIAVVLTLWSGYEFYRDVWRQRHSVAAG